MWVQEGEQIRVSHAVQSPGRVFLFGQLQVLVPSTIESKAAKS